MGEFNGSVPSQQHTNTRAHTPKAPYQKQTGKQQQQQFWRRRDSIARPFLFVFQYINHDKAEHGSKFELHKTDVKGTVRDKKNLQIT